MLSSDKITEIFFVIDEFCKNFNEVVSAHTIKQDNGKRREIVNQFFLIVK